MDAAIVEVAEQLGVEINEFTVAAIKNEHDDYIHQWVIVSDDNIDEAELAEKLDASLKEANKNYKVARNKALKGIKAEVISKQMYHSFLEKSKKKGGQVKTPKVMGEEKMNEYLVFLGS